VEDSEDLVSEDLASDEFVSDEFVASAFALLSFEFNTELDCNCELISKGEILRVVIIN